MKSHKNILLSLVLLFALCLSCSWENYCNRQVARISSMRNKHPETNLWVPGAQITADGPARVMDILSQDSLLLWRQWTWEKWDKDTSFYPDGQKKVCRQNWRSQDSTRMYDSSLHQWFDLKGRLIYHYVDFDSAGLSWIRRYFYDKHGKLLRVSTAEPEIVVLEGRD